MTTQDGGAETGAFPPWAANPDPYRSRAIWLVVLFAVMIPSVFVMMVAIDRGGPASRWGEPVPAFVAVGPGAVPGESLGRTVFTNSCALCHGPEGDGVPRLGKPLRNSAYVQAHTDDELFSVISTGRLPTDPENTTGVAMPPRGVTQSLLDDQLTAVIGYLREIQIPGEPVASLDAWLIPAGGAMTASGLVDEVTGIGHDVFVSSCSACHGAQGEGMEGLGKPLATSEFIASKTDDELRTFIKMGRPIWDAENTTGVDMPPKGGNPALQEEQIGEIITYIRALHARSEGE